MRKTLAVATLFCAFAVTALSQEQQPPKRYEDSVQLPLEPIERFSGPLPSRRNPRLANARIVLRHWNIANDQRVEIPHRGFLVVHLHSGEIIVVSGGNRTVRHGDEFWTVEPDEPLIIETARDSVVIRTLETITP